MAVPGHGKVCSAYGGITMKRFIPLIIPFISVLVPLARVQAQSTPPEAVHVHWDRDVYSAGMTAWFKAYVVSDHSLSARSTLLHVRISGREGATVALATLPVIGGTAAGQILIPDTVRTGVYILQAFTPGMVARGTTGVYERRVFIAGVPVAKGPSTPPTTPTLQVSFYPESGILLTGVQNRVAFRARHTDGRHIDIRGRIVDDTGLETGEAVVFRQGMGVFEVTPQAGRSYALEVDAEGSTRSFPLPSHRSDGVVMGVAPHPEGFVFTLRDRSQTPERRAAEVVGEMQGRTVFRVGVPVDRRDIRGVIRTDPETIRTGVLTFSAVNRDGMPLAERKVFVRLPDASPVLDLFWDTLDFSPRSSNRFTLKSGQPLDGDFSVSVNDGAIDPTGDASSPMLADLLLKPWLPGWTGLDADWYFKADRDSADKGLDMLMMTEGWSRIEWKDTRAQGNLKDQKGDPGFIVVSGVVEEPIRASPRRIMMLMEGPAFGRRTEYADVDAKGRFRIDSLLFFGDAGLSFFDPSVKKGKPLKVTLTSPPTGISQATFSFPSRFPKTATLPGVPDPSPVSAIGMFDSAVAMREIVVKAAAKSPKQRMNERYAHGFFADGEERLIDLTDPDEQPVQQNIFEYLKFRVPGIQVADPNYEVASMPGLGDDPFNDPQGYRVFYRQQPSISSMGNIPMAIYLNEVQTSNSVVATIPANQFVMVKVFSTFAPAPGGGAGGALALYTRDPFIPGDGQTFAPIRYKGFDIVREFPEPDPRLSSEASKAVDERRTFLWRPRLSMSKGIATLRFFSNAKPSTYRVSVRGVTADGRIVSLDRTVEK